MLLLVCALLLLDASQALASFGTVPRGQESNRSNTELVINRLGSGQGVSGFFPNAANPFDPVADGYPASNPSTAAGSGWSALNEGFAGIIHAKPPPGGEELSLYCIDISTGTNIGYGYALGTWDAANVPNVGYVARLLNQYYPHTDEPASLTNLNQRAAAVQAAIWFFTDRYVLSTSDPLHDTVVAIVNGILAAGPVVEPDPPSVSIDPTSRSGAGVLGPFTVTTDRSSAAVSATGADMFANAAATDGIANGDDVPSGQNIWLRSSSLGTAVLEASATATVPRGNVFLYDGNIRGVEDAQKLILAETGVLFTTVRATAEFRESGSLRVSKTIAGAAAGSQGPVVINVACDDAVDRPDFVIPAGATGEQTRTYEDIAAGTRCTVAETSNGHVVGVDVVVSGDEREVTIDAGRTEAVDVTNTYTFVENPVPSPGTGALMVTKTLTGPQAGSQGATTIRVTCDQTVLTPDFVLAARTSTGSFSRRFDVPAGSVCSVAEIADGSSEAVTTAVSGSGQTVVVGNETVVPVGVTNLYTAPGEVALAGYVSAVSAAGGFLRVTKTIAGPAAGRQGRAIIKVSCGGPLHAYVFRIPARTRARTVSRAFSELSPGDRCIVTETKTGGTGSVRAVTTRTRRIVTIPARGGVTVGFRDSFFPRQRAVSVTG
ncbi:MAG TPA: thioester domain-containing protein [Baekduia sp.]|nr:thioester domain-containing protein [Baekduia sp.]